VDVMETVTSPLPTVTSEVVVVVVIVSLAQPAATTPIMLNTTTRLNIFGIFIYYTILFLFGF
jgi:hypothetical protein